MKLTAPETDHIDNQHVLGVEMKTLKETIVHLQIETESSRVCFVQADVAAQVETRILRFILDLSASLKGPVLAFWNR
jgi:hypothetical protein